MKQEIIKYIKQKFTKYLDQTLKIDALVLNKMHKFKNNLINITSKYLCYIMCYTRVRICGNYI